MSTRKTIRKLGSFLLTLPVFFFILFPILWLLSASLSTNVELFAKPIHWIPAHPTLQNFIDIIHPAQATAGVQRDFLPALMNSIKVASAVTVIAITVGSMAAYALARIPFRFGRNILLVFITVRMVPEVSLILPLFILASRLQMINKPSVLILTYLSFCLPYAVWMLAAFFQTVPLDLEDAARLDGCSRIGILFRVVMPIAVPGLVSTAMFTFLLAWDEFFYALIFTSTTAAKTTPVAISEFFGRQGVNINGLMAGGIIAALPPIILALIFQRYIISGMTAGAVKG